MLDDFQCLDILYPISVAIWTHKLFHSQWYCLDKQNLDNLHKMTDNKWDDIWTQHMEQQALSGCRNEIVATCYRMNSSPTITSPLSLSQNRLSSHSCDRIIKTHLTAGQSSSLNTGGINMSILAFSMLTRTSVRLLVMKHHWCVWFESLSVLARWCFTAMIN